MPSDKQEGWVGFDLDGTLAYHEPSDTFDPLEIGEPIALMVQTAKHHLKEGYDVRIVTARVAPGRNDRDVEQVRKAVEDWTEQHLGERLQVTHEKDYGMLWLYDDRVRQVIPNTGITMGQLVAALRRMLDQQGANPEYAPEVEQVLEEEA